MALPPFGSAPGRAVIPSPLTAKLIDNGGMVFDVRAFGAVGDGVTDNFSALSSAITAAQTAGGIISFPPGVFGTLQGLNPLGHGIFFRGSGGPTGKDGVTATKGTIIKALPGYVGNTPIIQWNVPDSGGQAWVGGGVEDMNFYCNSVADGIYGLNMDQWTTNRVYIDHPWSSGVFAGAYNNGGGVDSVHIHHTKVAFAQCNTKNIYLGFNTHPGALVLGDAVYYSQISFSSQIVTVGDGLVLGGTNSNGTTNKIIGSASDAAGGRLFAIYGGTQHNFAGNTTFTPGTKSSLYLAANDCTVVGNTLSGANQTNNQTLGDGSSIFVDGGRGNLIASNKSKASSGHEVAGIYEKGVNSGVGNIYGPNIIQGYSTPVIINSGPSVSTFRENTGFNPFGSVTISVPATGVGISFSLIVGSGSYTYTSLPFDSTFYVTAGATSCTIAVSGMPTVTVPGSSTVPVFVPARSTVTPTYTDAPTWIVAAN